MADRGRYDSAMFWLAFGTAAAVIGLALMTIGVSRTTAGASFFASPWFDAGLALLVIGAALLLWSLGLFLSRRRAAPPRRRSRASSQQADAGQARDIEAVRGYYAERGKLIDEYFKDRAKDNPGPPG